MIQSFDWIINATTDSVYDYIFRRFGRGYSQKDSCDVLMASKIVPVKIPYHRLSDMLEGNLDECSGVQFVNE